MNSENSMETEEAGNSRVQAIKLVAYMDDGHACRIQTERLERKSKKTPEVININTMVEATSPEESQDVGI